MERAAKEPTILVIFGATGDLARRKLIPALFHLFSHDYLPEQFQIVGLSRDDLDHTGFRQFATKIIQEKSHDHTPDQLTAFTQHLHYFGGVFEDASLYTTLAEELSHIDQNQFQAACSNKLFYLAVPPVAYDVIFENLNASGLTIPCGPKEDVPPELSGWTRVLVEKPFGKDLTTAQALDAKLGKLFQEEQIFRIDHYLAKETVQNIISFRFANAIFEPVWDHEDIEKVSIEVSETIGVGQRASFYEDVGALRDVGQNHLLQMLALVAMEDPKELSATAIRTERAKVLDALKPIENYERQTTRGQYTGYRDEAGAATSETETYFRIKAYIENDRWQGVPFILASGKKLAEGKVEITITFKEPVSCVCPEGDQEHQNVLTIQVQPKEGISLKFWAKKPGLETELEPRTLSFAYAEGEMERMLPNAYEKVLYDCIRGDQTLFASTPEVTAAWKFITPILQNWSQVPLKQYTPGSTGPNNIR